MIPPAACTEAVPTRLPLAPTLKTALGPGGSLWSLFYLLLLFLQAHSPVPAPSSKRRAFCASAGQRGARKGGGGRQVGYQPARICGSCSQLPSATLVSHPSPSRISRSSLLIFCFTGPQGWRGGGVTWWLNENQLAICNTVPERYKRNPLSNHTFQAVKGSLTDGNFF